jgi:anti-anti-sigma regulatory factor/HAMP domain-containing protein
LHIDQERAMSHRRFALRLFALIQGSVILGMSLLVLSAFFLLDLGPTARRPELIRYIVYGSIFAVFLNLLAFWRLRSVRRLLKVWDRGQEPDESLSRHAQGQALTSPNHILIEFVGAVLVLIAIAIYADVKVLRYQLVQDLGNAALTVAFSLGMIFVISMGLRTLLRPVLSRISLTPLPTLGRFPVAVRMTLAVTLVSLLILVFAGAFVHSYVIKILDENLGQERVRWLEETVVPLAQSMSPAHLLAQGAQLARSGEELFLLNREARYVERMPARYELLENEVQVLAQQQAPFLYKRDFSLLRVAAVPLDDEQVLCVAYESQAGTLPIVQKMLHVLVASSLCALALAFSVGLVTSLDVSRTVHYVAERLVELASEDVPGPHRVISQTSLDEIGDLVQAFNRIQQQIDAYTEQLRESFSTLEKASNQRKKLLETTVGLTVPVIPVAEGLVVVPLSGYFDEERATHIRPNLLKGIADLRARVAIIDLTAIAEVSEPLAEHLSRTARSVTLMGCQVVLTGVSADVAWALTQVGSGLETLLTRRDLEDGLAYAYSRLAAN